MHGVQLSAPNLREKPPPPLLAVTFQFPQVVAKTQPCRDNSVCCTKLCYSVTQLQAVCPSVRLSHAAIDSKLITIVSSLSCSFHYRAIGSPRTLDFAAQCYASVAYGVMQCPSVCHVRGFCQHE